MKMAEPRTYRATTEAWFGQMLLPLCFFVLLTLTAIKAAITSSGPSSASRHSWRWH